MTLDSFSYLELDEVYGDFLNNSLPNSIPPQHSHPEAPAEMPGLRVDTTFLARLKIKNQCKKRKGSLKKAS
jgi:hypothetical protein